jgi:hypothetical protein
MFAVLAAGVLLSLDVLYVAGQTPETVVYQGRLTQDDGTPIVDQVTVTFALYNSLTGGESIWNEELQISPDENGVFTAELGKITSLTPAHFSGANLYLGLTVEGDQEMSPRQALGASPYCFRVNTIDGAAGGTLLGDLGVLGNVGIGTASPTEKLDVQGNLKVSGILAASPRVYMVENNNKITKDDNAWSDYMTTTITVDKNNSNVLIILDLSCTYEIGACLAVRAKVGSGYSNPVLNKYTTASTLQKTSFTFLLTNVYAGQHAVSVQWRMLEGHIITSHYYQDHAYNKMIVFVL